MTTEISFTSICFSLSRKQTYIQLLLNNLILPSLLIFLKLQNTNMLLIISHYPKTLFMISLFALCKLLQLFDQMTKKQTAQGKQQYISLLEKIELVLWILMHISLSQYKSFTNIVDIFRTIIIIKKFWMYFGIIVSLTIYMVPFLLCFITTLTIVNRKLQIKLQSLWFKKYNKQGFCVICLEKQTEIQLSCLHQYHLGCISKNCELIPKCPLCLKRIVFP